MGMYTDLICEATIKEEYRDRIHTRVFNDDLFDHSTSWKSLFSEEFASDFVNDERADMIPYAESTLTSEEIFDGRVLKIDCSLKNYTDTYEKFYEFLKVISEEIIEFRTYFEENYEWNYKTDMKTYFYKNYLTGKYDEYYSKE